MAYTINNFNGTQLTVVEDGTIDQTTDLKLVGKNYAGYGEIQNENFVFLLENFASAQQPPKPISGQIWFDSGNSKLKFYDGSQWRTTGGAEINASQPSGLSEGDFWWDTANEQLYAYNGTTFVLVGPQGVGDTVTQFKSTTIRDSGGTARPVIVSLIADDPIHVISSQQFTIGTEDAASYPGFDVIRQGITLKNTTNSTAGVTSSSHRFYGTASNADKLGGIAAANFVQAGAAEFSTLVEFADVGIAIGDSNDLKIKIVDDNKGLIANEQGQEVYIQVNNISAAQKMPVRFRANSILPGYSNVTTFTGTESVDIGASANKFGTIFATTFNGTSTLAQALEVSGTSRTGSTGAISDSVAVRDSSGNLTANIFNGTATSARFADLAERYETDMPLEPGDLVKIGGDKEITKTTHEHDVDVFGVISTNPAYMMNSDAGDNDTHPYVALAGRTPVKVIGTVSKGMRIASSTVPGIGIAIEPGKLDDVNQYAIIGRALENKEDTEIGSVEVVLGNK